MNEMNKLNGIHNRLVVNINIKTMLLSVSLENIKHRVFLFTFPNRKSEFVFFKRFYIRIITEKAHNKQNSNISVF
jgi:hypothetical protein